MKYFVLKKFRATVQCHLLYADNLMMLTVYATDNSQLTLAIDCVDITTAQLQ